MLSWWGIWEHRCGNSCPGKIKVSGVGQPWRTGEWLEICQAGLGISLGDSVLGLALGLVPHIVCVEGWAGKQKSGELEISQMNWRQKDVLARQVSTRWTRMGGTLRRKSSRGRQFSRFTLEIQARLGSKDRPLGWMAHERTSPSDTPARCKGVGRRQDSRLASVSSFINGEPLGRCMPELWVSFCNKNGYSYNHLIFFVAAL